MKEQYKKYTELVDKHKQLILDTERYLWKHPQVGYKEWEATEYLVRQYEKMGFQVKTAEGIPGFIADLDTGRPGPKLALIGELDSLMCATHPEADKRTNAVHACGHHCQSSAVLGCAAALTEPGALDGLCGSIRFVGVPAEETIDLEFRAKLIKEGKIHFNAGKIEFLYRGLFDDVDMVAMVHAMHDDDHMFHLFKGGNGCINKHFEFEGKASHAGTEPWNGVNALYEANVGMTACNALRETFRDTQTMRFHPIITQAGVAANAIPDVAKMDAYTRAASFEEMKKLNERINRALAASAAALGGNVYIQDKPGKMPLHCDGTLFDTCRDIITDLFGAEQIRYISWSYGSTDLGDLSSLMPAIHPEAAGISGSMHGADFKVADPVRSCVNPAKLLCCLAYELLHDDAALGRKIVREFKPEFESKEAYFEAINRVAFSGRAVEYLDNGDVRLHYKNN